MDDVVTGGLIGIGGTILGVVVQDRIALVRAGRERRQTQRVAITAMTSELLATASILHKALDRQAWWPEGDEPREIEWQRHRPVLVELLDRDALQQTTITYEVIRSLAATRASPLLPGRGAMNALRRRDPAGRTFFSLAWTTDRWPEADAQTRQTLDDIAALLDRLRPTEEQLLA
jgi:hypothetical protein